MVPPIGRGDGKVTGLLPSNTPVSVPPLMPRSMTGTPTVRDKYSESYLIRSMHNINISIPLQNVGLNPEPEPDWGHVNPKGRPQQLFAM